MGDEVAADSFLDGGKETLLAEVREKPEALQLVLDRILHLGEKHLDAGGGQCVVELGDSVSGGDVDAGHRLGGDDEPSDRGGRTRDGVENPVVEELGVGEEERRIPAEQDEPGIRWAFG